MYKDSNYQWCSYQWGLNEFLVRKDKDGIRQLSLFLNDGSKKVNYDSWKNKIDEDSGPEPKNINGIREF